MWLHGDEIDVPAWHAAGRERHLLDTTAIKNIKNRIQDALAAHERVMSASSAPHGYTELLANPLKPASLPKKNMCRGAYVDSSDWLRCEHSRVDLVAFHPHELCTIRA